MSSVDPSLESAASALRDSLATRGVPADELSEEVVLALAVVLAERDRRIGELERRFAGLMDRIGEWPDGDPNEDEGEPDPPPEYLRRRDAVAAWSAAAGVPGPIGLWQHTENQTPHPGSRIDGTVRVQGADGRWYTFPVFDDGTPGQVIDEALSRAQDDPATYQPNPDGRYPLCMPRIGQVDICKRCGEPIRPGDEYPCPGVPRESRWGPSVSRAETTRFRHDCESCVFLGRSECGRWDLYFCSQTRAGQLVARNGDHPQQIHSTSLGYARISMCSYPYLAEAYRRAVARGLAVGAGEGG